MMWNDEIYVRDDERDGWMIKQNKGDYQSWIMEFIEHREYEGEIHVIIELVFSHSSNNSLKAY